MVQSHLCNMGSFFTWKSWALNLYTQGSALLLFRCMWSKAAFKSETLQRFRKLPTEHISILSVVLSQRYFDEMHAVGRKERRCRSFLEAAVAFFFFAVFCCFGGARSKRQLEVKGGVICLCEFGTLKGRTSLQWLWFHREQLISSSWFPGKVEIWSWIQDLLRSMSGAAEKCSGVLPSDTELWSFLLFKGDDLANKSLNCYWNPLF